MSWLLKQDLSQVLEHLLHLGTGFFLPLSKASNFALGFVVVAPLLNFARKDHHHCHLLRCAFLREDLAQLTCFLLKMVDECQEFMEDVLQNLSVCIESEDCILRFVSTARVDADAYCLAAPGEPEGVVLPSEFQVAFSAAFFATGSHLLLEQPLQVAAKMSRDISSQLLTE